MKPLHIRKWLNPVTSRHRGWISAYCKTDEEDGYRDVDLTIGDCNKAISISLDVYNAKARKASIRKLHILLDTVEELQRAIIALDHVKDGFDST